MSEIMSKSFPFVGLYAGRKMKVLDPMYVSYMMSFRKQSASRA